MWLTQKKVNGLTLLVTVLRLYRVFGVTAMNVLTFQAVHFMEIIPRGCSSRKASTDNINGKDVNHIMNIKFEKRSLKSERIRRRRRLLGSMEDPQGSPLDSTYIPDSCHVMMIVC